MSLVARLEESKLNWGSMAQQPFSAEIAEMADQMGISLYQQFTQAEAALFLRCRICDLQKLQDERKIAYIQLTHHETRFFGFQLLEYLCSVLQPVQHVSECGITERILSVNEVQHMTRLSRTTLWRLERSGEFPARVHLSSSRIGWRYTDVHNWMKKC